MDSVTVPLPDIVCNLCFEMLLLYSHDYVITECQLQKCYCHMTDPGHTPGD